MPDDERTIGDELDDLQEVATKMVSLLEDRHPGLSTWFDFLGMYMSRMHSLIHHSGVDTKPDPAEL